MSSKPPESGTDAEHGWGAMTPEAFNDWMDAMGYRTREEAAEALGLSVDSIKHYKTGRRSSDGKPVVYPLTLALACSALYHRLPAWSGRRMWAYQTPRSDRR
ncbi:hypothetical protein FHW79_005400 [Azospirillum sp. OGB3]|uniref:hypothetical protein n=1 Tax=Azospirillum sp. OGB3 TaxID=2587012 RepID=UPI0017FFF37C|nr:hypothetical protein [Azospirillum sp. OGB3]MBB3267735.1 hypothetical protein [Azospirillum sp. OGB3]